MVSDIDYSGDNRRWELYGYVFIDVLLLLFVKKMIFLLFLLDLSDQSYIDST